MVSYNEETSLFNETFSLNETSFFDKASILNASIFGPILHQMALFLADWFGSLILPVPQHLASAAGDNAYTKHIGAPAMRKYVVFAPPSNRLEIWLGCLHSLVIQEPNMSFLMIWIAFKVYISKMTIPARALMRRGFAAGQK
jgi:hypothetical protein